MTLKQLLCYFQRTDVKFASAGDLLRVDKHEGTVLPCPAVQYHKGALMALARLRESTSEADESARLTLWAEAEAATGLRLSLAGAVLDGRPFSDFSDSRRGE
jgi:hypothetical protein